MGRDFQARGFLGCVEVSVEVGRLRCIEIAPYFIVGNDLESHDFVEIVNRAG